MRMTLEDWEELNRATGMDRVFAALEELLRAASRSTSRDGETRMVVPQKVNDLRALGRALSNPGSREDVRFLELGPAGAARSRRPGGFHYDRAGVRQLARVLLDTGANTFEAICLVRYGEIELGVTVPDAVIVSRAPTEGQAEGSTEKSEEDDRL